MTTIVKILLAVFMLSLVPTTYVCAQGSIETPAERKARQEREAAAKKKLQQDAAARRQREEEARKKREAEEARKKQEAEEEAACKERLASCGKFYEGLANFKDENYLYGFIDETGKIVISCKWKWADRFYDGIARDALGQ